jgi:hypothetical protein
MPVQLAPVEEFLQAPVAVGAVPVVVKAEVEVAAD